MKWQSEDVSRSTASSRSGWSRKHFIARFRHELGRSPKRLARVWRCGRAVAIVKKGGVIRMDDTFPARVPTPGTL
jgi:AraC-like DNA-binding protein